MSRERKCSGKERERGGVGWWGDVWRANREALRVLEGSGVGILHSMSWEAYFFSCTAVLDFNFKVCP